MWRITRLSFLLLCFFLVLSVSNVFAQTWMKGKISFWSYNENHKYGVYIMDADGSNVTKILDDEIPRWSPNVALSPDCKKVAFEIGGINDADIAIFEIDNGKLVNLTGDKLIQCALPRWSPDGQNIAIAASIMQDNNIENHIWVMNHDGNSLKRLTNNDMRESIIDWGDPDLQIGVGPLPKSASTWGEIKTQP